MQNGFARRRLAGGALIYTAVFFWWLGVLRTARVGHLFECDDGIRRKVLAIDSGDPVCVLLEGGRMLSIPCGSIVQVGESTSPKAARTVEAVPAAVVSPVHRGSVKAVTYHSGAAGPRTLTVGDLIDGRLRLVGIMPGDPVTISLLDARGEITSREVCGLGSVAEFRRTA